MMADSTPSSDLILRDARRSLETQRGGGTHRRTGAIGRGSASLRARHLGRKLKRMAAAVAAIVVAAIAAGLIVDGIGFVGIMVSALLIIGAITIISAQKLKPPRRADLARIADARQLVARTELWLEHQRPALPPPAVPLVDQIGVQLDSLGIQLEHVEPGHPAAVETRKLVGETLPGMIDAYRKIPVHLRREPRAGGVPDDQLVESLGKISREIDSVTRQLADGALDDLAIRTRYLDYRYGDAGEPEALPSAAPAPPELPGRQEP